MIGVAAENRRGCRPRASNLRDGSVRNLDGQCFVIGDVQGGCARPEPRRVALG